MTDYMYFGYLLGQSPDEIKDSVRFAKDILRAGLAAAHCLIFRITDIVDSSYRLYTRSVFISVSIVCNGLGNLAAIALDEQTLNRNR
jgi:hypothetical protein